MTIPDYIDAYKNATTFEEFVENVKDQLGENEIDEVEVAEAWDSLNFEYEN